MEWSRTGTFWLCGLHMAEFRAQQAVAIMRKGFYGAIFLVLLLGLSHYI